VVSSNGANTLVLPVLGIIYKSPDVPHSESPTYRPMLVGEDFLYRSGVIVDVPASGLSPQPAYK